MAFTRSVNAADGFEGGQRRALSTRWAARWHPRRRKGEALQADTPRPPKGWTHRYAASVLFHDAQVIVHVRTLTIADGSAPKSIDVAWGLRVAGTEDATNTMEDTIVETKTPISFDASAISPHESFPAVGVLNMGHPGRGAPEQPGLACDSCQHVSVGLHRAPPGIARVSDVQEQSKP